ncbi:hypothetical protein R0131_13260 [Clostridium sp. AL.422]|uniref:hypothetical protein n=1 Tax=Clostridium TaxID=1485 RepID=UPI00293DEF24|nr:MULTISPECIES: hypothetical protein [unclassified Clostridium]MDV4151790.1 hypothetical protein [Clostridium sp. AL.422]
MKTNSKILLVVLGIFVFLIFDQIRVSANSAEEVIETNLGIETLIDYINELELTEEELEFISEKSKTISQDVKGKTAFKEYKITDIIRIYRNFTAMANSLNLNIDFSIKNGDFTLKDKSSGNSIFSGNVSKIKSYFSDIKNNTKLLSMDVLANIDNEDIADSKEEIINDDSNINKDDLDNTKQEENKNRNIIENVKENSSIEKSLGLGGTNDMIIPISILVIAFSVIVISYIKFR